MSVNNFDYNNGSGTPGRPEGNESVNSGSSAVDLAQKENLEKVVGRQGEELGELRKFMSDMAPLFEKLDSNPELVQAILDGKIDKDLTKAVIDGNITIGEAKVITEAHTSVQKELGEKKYDKTSADDIAKLVDEKVSEIRGEFMKKIKEDEELRSFETNVSDFITNTPDFAKYAEDVNQWLEEHDVTDIRVAYYAVKGELSEKEARDRAAIDQAEYEKNLILNAGGGNSRVTYSGGEAERVVDSLIASKASANHF